MARDERPFIGIDLGGTNIQVGILDHKDRLIAREKTKTKAEEGAEAVVKRISKTVRETLEEANLGIGEVGGLGIGAPGVVDMNKGVVVIAANLRWNKFPLAKALTDELKIGVTVDNDVNVGTWGEYVGGAGKGYDDLLGVFVGTGIGGGVILNGKLYSGHFMTAGEIGHTISVPDAPLGRRTLENLASRTSIVDHLVHLIQTNHPSKVEQIVGGNLSDVRSKVLAQAIEEKDALTIEVLGYAAHYVGIAIANFVTVMSFPCVVLGGGLTAALGKTWVEAVRQSFEANVYPSDLKECKILAGKFGDDAGIIGAAMLGRERLGKR